MIALLFLVIVYFNTPVAILQILPGLQLVDPVLDSPVSIIIQPSSVINYVSPRERQLSQPVPGPSGTPRRDPVIPNRETSMAGREVMTMSFLNRGTPYSSPRVPQGVRQPRRRAGVRRTGGSGPEMQNTQRNAALSDITSMHHRNRGQSIITGARLPPRTAGSYSGTRVSPRTAGSYMGRQPPMRHLNRGRSFNANSRASPRTTWSSVRGPSPVQRRYRPVSPSSPNRQFSRPVMRSSTFPGARVEPFRNARLSNSPGQVSSERRRPLRQNVQKFPSEYGRSNTHRRRPLRTEATPRGAKAPRSRPSEQVAASHLTPPRNTYPEYVSANSISRQSGTSISNVPKRDQRPLHAYFTGGGNEPKGQYQPDFNTGHRHSRIPPSRLVTPSSNQGGMQPRTGQPDFYTGQKHSDIAPNRPVAPSSNQGGTQPLKGQPDFYTGQTHSDIAPNRPIAPSLNQAGTQTLAGRHDPTGTLQTPHQTESRPRSSGQPPSGETSPDLVYRNTNAAGNYQLIQGKDVGGPFTILRSFPNSQQITDFNPPIIPYSPNSPPSDYVGGIYTRPTLSQQLGIPNAVPSNSPNGGPLQLPLFANLDPSPVNPGQLQPPVPNHRLSNESSLPLSSSSNRTPATQHDGIYSPVPKNGTLATMKAHRPPTEPVSPQKMNISAPNGTYPQNPVPSSSVFDHHGPLVEPGTPNLSPALDPRGGIPNGSVYLLGNLVVPNYAYPQNLNAATHYTNGTQQSGQVLEPMNSATPAGSHTLNPDNIFRSLGIHGVNGAGITLLNRDVAAIPSSGPDLTSPGQGRAGDMMLYAIPLSGGQNPAIVDVAGGGLTSPTGLVAGGHSPTSFIELTIMSASGGGRQGPALGGGSEAFAQGGGSEAGATQTAAGESAAFTGGVGGSHSKKLSSEVGASTKTITKSSGVAGTNSNKQKLKSAAQTP